MSCWFGASLETVETCILAPQFPDSCSEFFLAVSYIGWLTLVKFVDCESGITGVLVPLRTGDCAVGPAASSF